MLQNLFIEILITSCIGAALAGILALIRPITQKHFSSRWHYYMWLVVLAVMMCPIRLNLPESQPGSASEPAQISAVQTTDTTQRTTDEAAYTVSEPQTTVNEAIYEEQQETATEPKHLIILDIIMSGIGILPVLWLTVAVLLFTFKLIGYETFLLRMKRNSHIIECEKIKEYTNRKITVRSSGNISSPLMIGIIKPVLLLPDAFLTEEQLDNILKHEMTHFKRRDILYKWFTAIVKCIHWFNPAIYLISHQINIECEISCDMAVTADMSREEEISYIDTILALVTKANSKTVPLTTGMADSKKILKKRFLTIRNRINTTKSARIFSRIAAIVTATATLTASIAVLSGCDLPGNTGTASTAEPMNCLVAGTDEDGRIDTILLVSTDFENATVISIPRDTKDIKEKYPSGLTGGNVEELQKIISNMLKIDIDKYVVIDLDTALKALSEIDGLELSIPDLYNDGVGMVYDDEYKDLHISLNPGEHALSAKEMLDYMRYVKRNPEYYLNGRDTSQDGGSLGRLYRQNDMLLDIMQQKQDMFDKTNLLQLAKSIPAYSKTNLTYEDMKNLYSLAKSIDPGNIYFDVLPGMYEYIDNIPYYIPEYSEIDADILSHTYKPMNTDKIYQGNGFSIVLPNAEITENSYKSGENFELLRAKILSVGSIAVQIEEKEYSSYDRDKILENYEGWRDLDGERAIEDFRIITDESGTEIGRSYALVIDGEVMQYRSEYKYGNDTDKSYALVKGDGETLEKRNKYNQRNSTLIVLGQPMTGEVFDSEANAELIKKYIDSFRLHDVSNPLMDTELTPQRIAARIFVNGVFTDKQPIMRRDDKYTLEEYDIPQDIVLDSVFNRTNMGAAADEVDVIKTKDTALVMEKLQEHFDKQVDKFKSDPHEHEKLNDAVLTTYGDIVIFAVSENSEAVRWTIANIIKE